MDDFITTPLETLLAQAYVQAYAHHGDLGLTAEAFSSHLYSIIDRRVGASVPALAVEFINRLHFNDLYLAVACAQPGERAWGHFAAAYGSSVRRICDCLGLSRDEARDLADSLPGYLFLPDSSGRSRIASYDGLSSLATWLAVIIKRRAMRLRRPKSFIVESIGQVTDVSDDSGMLKIETTLRSSRYDLPIRESLRAAVKLLNDRERLILRLRYEQEMQVSQIARLLGVGPPAISRQLDRTSKRLRQAITSTLATEHQLNQIAIEECVAVLLDDPRHSILALNNDE
jgi:RNA polymerase sigma-70 factor, ECF subfamily